MKKSIPRVLISLTGLAILLLLAFGSTETKKDTQAEVQRMGALPISDIQWEEIDRIYNLKNNYTDLQKKELWKNYKGKKVKWTGSVSSVSETMGTLSIQVKMNSSTFTSDLLIRMKEAERSKALQLKEDSPVTFTGILNDWGTIMPITLDHGEIAM